MISKIIGLTTILLGLFSIRKQTKAFVFPMYLVLECLWLGTFIISLLLKGKAKPLLFITNFESFIYVLMAIPVFFGGTVVIKKLFNFLSELKDPLKK